MNSIGHRESAPRAASASSELEQGRACYERCAWREAFESLSVAERTIELNGGDLELLAMSAYLIGRDDDYLAALDRAYEAYLATDSTLRAVRCAFWLGLRLLFRGEDGRANGWLSRAQNLLEREGSECVEQGYLLLPVVQQHAMAGDCQAAYDTAARAVAIGDRFDEPDLSACAKHLQGRALLQQGEVARGLVLLDQVMLTVITGALSPIVRGLIYCSVIEGCQQVYALRRAHEWTTALRSWCDEQPELVAFTGTCLVHRAEVMQLHGAWQDAIEEARRACDRCTQAGNQRMGAAALYQQAEIYRLRGDFLAADEAYRSASLHGCDPQPGLALLRLAQGRIDAADAAIRRAVSTTTDQLQRTRLLPPYIEVLLATGEISEARAACSELEQTAEHLDTGFLDAIATQARGAIDLAAGDALTALDALRRAWEMWQQLELPYMAARARMLMGLACHTLGDSEGSELELEAARAAFERLGASPDCARIDALRRAVHSGEFRDLTQRELQVLRLVATGKTNKIIARELSLSEKTIDRHVSNIFCKLDVTSRAAATAYAYEHKLV